MLTLIHGDDTVLSRKTLEEIKLKNQSFEKINFDGNKLNLTDIVQATDSMSFFAEKKLIIIENLLSVALSKEKEAILEFLKSAKTSSEVVLWEQKEIGKNMLKKYFTEAKIIFCRLPAILFRFLDSIGDKSISSTLANLKSLNKDRGAEFVLTMLVRQWRFLIIASDLGVTGFADMPSWQAFKFVKQARFFKLSDLISSYRQLLSLDLKVKMGFSPYDLNQLLDIFFVSLYYGF